MSDLTARAEAKLSGIPALLGTAEERFARPLAHERNCDRADRSRVLFGNADWTVTPDGLEHRNGYFIEREAVGQRRDDGRWMWPLHMTEKLWCAPDSFGEAFSAAVHAYGLDADAGLVLAFQEVTQAASRADLPPAYDLRRQAACTTGQGRRTEIRAGLLPYGQGLAAAA